MTDDRLSRVLRDLAPVESKPRKRELLWIVVFLVLLFGFLGKNDYAEQKMIEQRKSELRPALSMMEPDDFAWYRRHERQKAKCPAQQYVSQCCDDARSTVTCLEETWTN